MGDLLLGTNRPDAFYVGTSPVDAVYLGAEQVWPASGWTLIGPAEAYQYARGSLGTSQNPPTIGLRWNESTMFLAMRNNTYAALANVPTGSQVRVTDPDGNFAIFLHDGVRDSGTWGDALHCSVIGGDPTAIAEPRSSCTLEWKPPDPIPTYRYQRVQSQSWTPQQGVFNLQVSDARIPINKIDGNGVSLPQPVQNQDYMQVYLPNGVFIDQKLITTSLERDANTWEFRFPTAWTTLTDLEYYDLKFPTSDPNTVVFTTPLSLIFNNSGTPTGASHGKFSGRPIVYWKTGTEGRAFVETLLAGDQLVLRETGTPDATLILTANWDSAYSGYFYYDTDPTEGDQRVAIEQRDWLLTSMTRIPA